MEQHSCAAAPARKLCCANGHANQPTASFCTTHNCMLPVGVTPSRRGRSRKGAGHQDSDVAASKRAADGDATPATDRARPRKLQKLGVVALRELCVQSGLPMTGFKKELIARLEQAREVSPSCAPGVASTVHLQAAGSTVKTPNLGAQASSISLNTVLSTPGPRSAIQEPAQKKAEARQHEQQVRDSNLKHSPMSPRTPYRVPTSRVCILSIMRGVSLSASQLVEALHAYP